MKKRNTILSILTIDPGFKTGWACFKYIDPNQSKSILKADLKTNLVTGCFSALSYLPFIDKINELCLDFGLFIQNNPGNTCIIERVEMWPASPNSYIPSLKRKGEVVPDLIKLSYLIGGYLEICRQFGVSVKLINFSKWGGQLKPSGIRAQVEHILNRKFKNQLKKSNILGIDYIYKPFGYTEENIY